MELNIPLTYSVLFGCLVTMAIPSIMCSFFILFHFFRSRQLRRKLNNHIILIFVLINLIQVSVDMPLSLILFQTKFVPIQSGTFCRFWIVFNYGINVVNLMFMAYGCIERYFLVFHRVFFKKHLITLHYGPLLLFPIYSFLLYIGLIAVYPCETAFDYTQFVCGGSCYQYQFALGLFDWFCNLCAPVLVGAVATTMLIVRVLLQKRRVGQRAIWRHNRKMVVQLAAVSIMYIVIWMPSIISNVIVLIIPNAFILQLAAYLFIYFQYIGCLLCPFMSMVGLPEVRAVIKRPFIRRNIVHPQTQDLVQSLRLRVQRPVV